MTIIVEIDHEDIRKAKQYTVEKYKFSYKRLGETEKEEQFLHLFIGKLGELIGKKAVDSINIPNVCEDMLVVVKDQYYKDNADIILFPETLPMKVDIKTSWKYQIEKTYLVIPEDQFENQIKDLYIGVKVYPTKIYESPLLPDIQKEAKVFGWVLREDLQPPDTCPLNLFGRSFWILFEDLRPLEELFELVSQKERALSKKEYFLSDFIV